MTMPVDLEDGSFSIRLGAVLTWLTYGLFVLSWVFPVRQQFRLSKLEELSNTWHTFSWSSTISRRGSRSTMVDVRLFRFGICDGRLRTVLAAAGYSSLGF